MANNGSTNGPITGQALARWLTISITALVLVAGATVYLVETRALARSAVEDTKDVRQEVMILRAEVMDQLRDMRLDLRRIDNALRLPTHSSE